MWSVSLAVALASDCFLVSLFRPPVIPRHILRSFSHHLNSHLRTKSDVYQPDKQTALETLAHGSVLGRTGHFLKLVLLLAFSEDGCTIWSTCFSSSSTSTSRFALRPNVPVRIFGRALALSSGRGRGCKSRLMPAMWGSKRLLRNAG